MAIMALISGPTAADDHDVTHKQRHLDDQSPLMPYGGIDSKSHQCRAMPASAVSAPSVTDPVCMPSPTRPVTSKWHNITLLGPELAAQQPPEPSACYPGA